jgi:Helix-turn-helix domain
VSDQGFAAIPRSMLHDSTIPHDAKLVYLVLSSHVGGNKSSWPSHRRIAEMLGISVSTVKRQLMWLREHKFVTWIAHVDESSNARVSNEYTLLVSSAESTNKPGSTRATRSPRRTTPSSQGTGATVTQIEPLAQGELTPSPQGATEVKSLNESHGTKNIPSTGVDAAFAEFWKIYPRKVGREGALKVYKSALRKTDMATIRDGAQRYRDDPNREDQFTAHPSTWLNRGSWNDDPLPKRGAKSAPAVDNSWMSA